MANRETVGDRAQEDFGISEDFAYLADAGSAVILVIDGLMAGADLPEDLISQAVNALGTAVGYITVKYDPALNQKQRKY